MSDLTKLDSRLDETLRTCRVVIETPQGSRSKYTYDAGAGAFEISGLLAEGLSFPLAFGFVPSTCAEDGDPLDILVLYDEPSAVGAILDVRLIGVIEADQTEKGQTRRNDRLLGVACISKLYSHIVSVTDLESSYLDHIKAFWIQYNALKGKTFIIQHVRGPQAALDAIHRTKLR